MIVLLMLMMMVMIRVNVYSFAIYMEVGGCKFFVSPTGKSLRIIRACQRAGDQGSVNLGGFGKTSSSRSPPLWPRRMKIRRGYPLKPFPYSALYDAIIFDLKLKRFVQCKDEQTIVCNDL